MRLTKCWLGVFLMAVTVASPIVVAGCAERTTGRVYDPYYGDYHGWGDSEVVFYRQWVVETHRPYRELRALPPEQQWEYRNWRATTTGIITKNRTRFIGWKNEKPPITIHRWPFVL